MDYKTAVREMGAHDSFVCCGPVLGLPARAAILGDLLDPARLKPGQLMPPTFEVEQIDELPWIIHGGRVVLRPTMRPHRVERHDGSEVVLVPNEHAGIAAAIDIECRARGQELVAVRDAGRWAAGFGAVSVRGGNLEGALRSLIRPLERQADRGAQ